ncbi:MAG: CPBP family intramembrane glutamic endopeptidase [Anaerolineae bacterium]|nr:CPBP family intramembrane glutamic endopeptidase [Anaerolineae bacterium]
MQEQSRPVPPAIRALIAFVAPLFGAVLLGVVVALLVGGPDARDPSGRASTTLILGGLGITSLIFGVRWYGFDDLGLRGGRPLYASIGFATVAWLIFLAARLLVPSNTNVVVAPDFGRAFIYLLLFEAFALQLWTFGFLFRELANWRGPLTAAVTCGILFGAIASQFFEEAYIETTVSVMYFLVWGVLYGLIRLRTGSFLGTVIIQAMHSLTAWYILLPGVEPTRQELHPLYLISATLYLMLIWRLWPKTEEDYRI